MKKLALLLITSSSLLSSEVKVAEPEALFTLSALSRVQNISEKRLYQFLSTLSDNCKRILIKAYLEHHGYKNEEALVYTTSSLFVEKEVAEEPTTFFSEGEEEGHYRPTRFPQNPFVETDGSPFCFTYQEKHTLFSQLRDHREDKKSYKSGRFVGRENIFVVGPTKQGYYASFGDEDHLAVCKLVRDKVGRLRLFRHKCEEGPIDEATRWKRFGRGKSYKPDTITALTMDEEKGFFYGATELGKVHCYHSYINEATESIEWAKSDLPIALGVPIDDLELSDDGTILWLLSNNYIYKYDLRSAKPELLDINIPVLPSEDVEDEAKETMCVLRRAPYANHLVLGGTKGTIVLVNVEKERCYILDSFKEHKPVVDIWWNSEGSFVTLNRVGTLRKGTILLAYVENFLPKKTPSEE